MQSLKLVPADKPCLNAPHRKINRGENNAFSFLEKDATCGFSGKKMKTLSYLDNLKNDREKL